MYGDLVDTATHLHGYLSNEIPYDEVDFKQLAIFVRSEIDRDIEVEALWTKDRRPQTSAEWRAACNSLINHFWPDDASAAAWANDRRLEYLQDLKQAEDEVRDIVAKQILAGSLEKTTVLGARLGRELERQQKLLRVMQSKEDEG